MSGWLSLAITIILVVVAYLILNRTITNRTSQQAALEDIKREVGAIITELNSTTERNIELIEDRISTLEQLIAQADKRVGALRRDLASRSSEATTYSRPVSPRRDEPPAAGSPGEADHFFVSRTGSVREDATPGSSRPAASREPSPREPSPRERVRSLYLQGVAVERIASLVGKTVGEVELIISLDEGAER